jgi:glycosyltransferase involved in cell wall biosynthesis
VLKLRFYLADQNPHRDRSRGISVYCHGLLEMLRRDPELQVSALCSRSSFRPSEGQPEIVVHELPFRTDGHCRRLVADLLHPALARFAQPPIGAADTPDLWHFPKGFLPTLRRPAVPVVGTVHDTILVHYATHYPADRSHLANSYWLGLLERSLTRFDLVLTDSEFSRRSIEAFCAARRIPCPRISVTFLGARFEDCALKPRPGQELATRDQVLHLISPLPHKRSDTLLEFWQCLEQQRSELPRLRLIGSSSARQRVRSAQLRRVTACEAVPEEDLAETMSSSRALLLPSEIEGFGLPALEAYYLGTPVVYVKGTAVEEVLGEGTPGGFLLDDVDSFGAALDEVLALDPEWIADKAAALRSRFSWRACAERTIAAYREVS